MVLAKVTVVEVTAVDVLAIGFLGSTVGKWSGKDGNNNEANLSICPNWS